jgi:predicted DsbA family dithiol-disulfide isomerase
VITASLYSDPTCPFGYSTSPTQRVLEWRYGDQLDWRLVVIVLSDDPAQIEASGFTPLRLATSQVTLRRYGMPFAPEPKPRVAASSHACRAVQAARMLAPGSEWAAYRALQFAHFTTAGVLDEDGTIREALATWTDLEADAAISLIDTAEVEAAYERDRADARTAAGSAAVLQGKASIQGDTVRYTAGTIAFQNGGERMVAGGFQPLEAYDVLIVNIDPSLERRPAPDSPLPVLNHFRAGVTTQEVAAVLASGNEPPDRPGAERALLELVADGAASRTPLGDDALWRTAA